MLRVDARTGVQVSPDISRFVERERASELRLVRVHGGIKGFGLERWGTPKKKLLALEEFQFVGIKDQFSAHSGTGS